MTKKAFLDYAVLAATDLEFDLSVAPLQRWHRGFNLPGGGRIYFEWRAR
jgi:hypothetical protein